MKRLMKRFVGVLAMGAGMAMSASTSQAQQHVPAGLPSPQHIIAPPQPTALPLYPDAAPADEGERWDRFGAELIVRNVAVPTITPVLPDPVKATGAAVVIAPGGGFMILSIQNEGWDVAHWLADHGIAAFVLKYRVQPTPQDEPAFEKFALAKLFQPIKPGQKQDHPNYAPAIADGLAAMRYVKAHAVEWSIDPARVGMIGFSAGAATALQVALTSADDARPAFVGLLYCPQPPTAIALPVVVPPLFIAVAADDPVVGPDTSALDAWRAAGKPAEFHLYGKGGHGFGMHRSGATTDLWPDEFLVWVRSNGFLQPDHMTQP